MPTFIRDNIVRRLRRLVLFERHEGNEKCLFILADDQSAESVVLPDWISDVFDEYFTCQPAYLLDNVPLQYKELSAEAYTKFSHVVQSL